jgi:hypothetical protein
MLALEADAAAPVIAPVDSVHPDGVEFVQLFGPDGAVGGVASVAEGSAPG